MKKYLNPNIPKPTPGSDTGKEPRYKKQPVKTTPPVRKKGPGGGPKPVKVLSMISKRKPAPKNKGGR